MASGIIELFQHEGWSLQQIDKSIVCKNKTISVICDFSDKNAFKLLKSNHSKLKPLIVLNTADQALFAKKSNKLISDINEIPGPMKEAFLRQVVISLLGRSLVTKGGVTTSDLSTITQTAADNIKDNYNLREALNNAIRGDNLPQLRAIFVTFFLNKFVPTVQQEFWKEVINSFSCLERKLHASPDSRTSLEFIVDQCQQHIKPSEPLNFEQPTLYIDFLKCKAGLLTEWHIKSFSEQGIIQLVDLLLEPEEKICRDFMVTRAFNSFSCLDTIVMQNKPKLLGHLLKLVSPQARITPSRYLGTPMNVAIRFFSFECAELLLQQGVMPGITLQGNDDFQGTESAFAWLKLANQKALKIDDEAQRLQAQGVIEKIRSPVFAVLETYRSDDNLFKSFHKSFASAARNNSTLCNSIINILNALGSMNGSQLEFLMKEMVPYLIKESKIADLEKLLVCLTEMAKQYFQTDWQHEHDQLAFNRVFSVMLVNFACNKQATSEQINACIKASFLSTVFNRLGGNRWHDSFLKDNPTIFQIAAKHGGAGLLTLLIQLELKDPSNTFQQMVKDSSCALTQDQAGSLIAASRLFIPETKVAIANSHFDCALIFIKYFHANFRASDLSGCRGIMMGNTIVKSNAGYQELTTKLQSLLAQETRPQPSPSQVSDRNTFYAARDGSSASRDNEEEHVANKMGF